MIKRVEHRQAYIPVAAHESIAGNGWPLRYAETARLPHAMQPRTRRLVRSGDLRHAHSFGPYEIEEVGAKLDWRRILVDTDLDLADPLGRNLRPMLQFRAMSAPNANLEHARETRLIRARFAFEARKFVAKPASSKGICPEWRNHHQVVGFHLRSHGLPCGNPIGIRHHVRRALLHVKHEFGNPDEWDSG